MVESTLAVAIVESSGMVHRSREAGEVRCAAAGQPHRYDERASQQEVVLDLRLSTIGAVRGLDDVPVV
jgi:hypothetical protein